MTRKHFNAIAKAIARSPIPNTYKMNLVRQIGTCLAESNTRFDMNRFVEACYAIDYTEVIDI